MVEIEVAVDPGSLSPAQGRLHDEVLAPAASRPALTPGLAERLRAMLEAGISELVPALDPDEPLVLTKGDLGALSCDGRYLDRIGTEFRWSVPVARGIVAHRVIELDWISGRVLGVDAVVDRAWALLREERPNLGGYLDGLDEADASAVRAEARQLVLELRDLWPPIPTAWSPRLETRLACSLADGAVQLRGTPDLMIGAVHGERRQVVIVDLKTGWRRPQEERQDLRFYALLFTLKYGVEPFRLVTYYVSEGAWDVEDLTAAHLEAAAHRVVDAVARSLHLQTAGELADLRLVPGPYCAWCGRAPACTAYAEAGDVVFADGP